MCDLQPLRKVLQVYLYFLLSFFILLPIISALTDRYLGTTIGFVISFIALAAFFIIFDWIINRLEEDNGSDDLER